jgi:hypothetical protein
VNILRDSSSVRHDYSVKERFQELWIKEKVKLSSMLVRCLIEDFNQRLTSFLQILSRVNYGKQFATSNIWFNGWTNRYICRNDYPSCSTGTCLLDACWNTGATCRVMIVFTIARLSCRVAKLRFKNIGYARRIKSVFRI